MAEAISMRDVKIMAQLPVSTLANWLQELYTRGVHLDMDINGVTRETKLLRDCVRSQTPDDKMPIAEGYLATPKGAGSPPMEVLMLRTAEQLALDILILRSDIENRQKLHETLLKGRNAARESYWRAFPNLNGADVSYTPGAYPVPPAFP